MLNASEFIDPIVSRASVVEDRTWRHGIEIISHVNYDQLAKVRFALGLMPDACGRTLNEASFVQLARRHAPTVSDAPPALAAPSVQAGIVLWSDIMEQIARVDAEASSAPSHPATTELHFGPVLHQEPAVALLRSA